MRVAIFIDNSNVLHRINELKKKGDLTWPSFYDPLFLSQKLTGSNRELVCVNFYCTRPPLYINTEMRDRVNKYYSFIEKMPFLRVKYGELRGCRGELREKNLDTRLVADIIVGAVLNKYDTAIIISNDGDYVSAIKKVRGFNKKVEVVFFRGQFSMDSRAACNLPRRAHKSHFKRLEMK
ncbi:MAG: NYN domain-containing protein [Candidatus Paceibacterota bacterium]|jgi:uncharacterized LabA/DUF88 family protein